MSLGKLLATGRSLAGSPAMGRYNVSESNRLPKFNAARNPFAQPAAKPAAQPEPAAAPVSAPVAAPAPAVAQSPGPVAGPVPANSPFSAAVAQPAQPRSPMTGAAWWQRAQNAQAAAAALVKRVPALVQAGGRRLLALSEKLLGRFKRVRRRQQPVSVIPRFGIPAGAVQGELSLDNVRVVRNDLEESDLEIVTAQTNTAAQVAPTVPAAAPNRGPMPAALKKLTNRITGVNVS